MKNKAGRTLSVTLLTQSLNHVINASPKLRRWYHHLCEYKKAGWYGWSCGDGCSRKSTRCSKKGNTTMEETPQNAERMNGILKQAYALGGGFKSKAQAKKAVDETVYLFNPNLRTGL
jgi:hypothetical protein